MLDADYVVRFTRQELYELVWTEPVYKIAPRLRISNVGLAKACSACRFPSRTLGTGRSSPAGSTLNAPRVASARLLPSFRERDNYHRKAAGEPHSWREGALQRRT